MTTISKAITQMIAYYKGDIHYINHFLKVYAYAKTIGEEENLNPHLQQTLELAAIVHDIACPYCNQKYGCSVGYYQQLESEPLVREFFSTYDLPQNQLERIVYLVTHHHTYTNVDGLDYQILLEADYLVNFAESEKYARNLNTFRTKIFKTHSGLSILESILSLETHVIKCTAHGETK